uniref:Uncharacterized protein n=1 Tax=Tanacetum cinerariifolium TaxID=118510 RepID=A0A699L4N6_TANCI|nr:hypothetical protein [Tanacetum cinerariifolium]
MLVHEFILEFFSTFRFGEAVLDLDTAGALQFQFGRVKRRMSWREFIMALGLHSAEEMDPMLRLCYILISCSITRRIQAPKKGAMIFGGQFAAPLAENFGPARQKGDLGGVVEEDLVAPEGGDEDEEMP